MTEFRNLKVCTLGDNSKFMYWIWCPSENYGGNLQTANSENINNAQNLFRHNSPRIHRICHWNNPWFRQLNRKSTSRVELLFCLVCRSFQSLCFQNIRKKSDNLHKVHFFLFGFPPILVTFSFLCIFTQITTCVWQIRSNCCSYFDILGSKAIVLITFFPDWSCQMGTIY